MSEIDELRAQIRELKRRMDTYPVRSVGGKIPVYAVQVAAEEAAGNTLATGWYGIKRTTSVITTIPSGATPAGTAADLPDGLGRGAYLAPGETTPVPCFVIVDALSQGETIDEGRVAVSFSIALLNSGSGTTSYPCLRIGR